MGKVVAGITISVDGFITGPGDGPGCGLGVGSERLHYWVFGAPCSYPSPGRGEPAGEDKAWLDETVGANGAVIASHKKPATATTRRSSWNPQQYLRDFTRIAAEETTTAGIVARMANL
jgi:hypothetical protein